jgi:hypothetical protein
MRYGATASGSVWLASDTIASCFYVLLGMAVIAFALCRGLAALMRFWSKMVLAEPRPSDYDVRKSIAAWQHRGYRITSFVFVYAVCLAFASGLWVWNLDSCAPGFGDARRVAPGLPAAAGLLFMPALALAGAALGPVMLGSVYGYALRGTRFLETIWCLWGCFAVGFVGGVYYSVDSMPASNSCFLLSAILLVLGVWLYAVQTSGEMSALARARLADQALRRELAEAVRPQAPEEGDYRGRGAVGQWLVITAAFLAPTGCAAGLAVLILRVPEAVSPTFAITPAAVAIAGLVVGIICAVYVGQRSLPFAARVSWDERGLEVQSWGGERASLRWDQIAGIKLSHPDETSTVVWVTTRDGGTFAASDAYRGFHALVAALEVNVWTRESNA